MNIKLSYLLLMNLPKATSVLFSGSRSNTEQIKEDLESLKASGKLTALNMECIEKESNFAVNVVKPEQMLPPTADAVANATAITISSTMTEKKAPEIRRGIIKHELTHSNLSPLLNL